jgi:hypothetical protein
MAEQHPSGGQEPTQDELVMRLLAHPAHPQTQQLQLLPGRLPDTLPLKLPLPDGSRVVGSLVRGQESVEVVLDAPGSAEQVLAWYQQQMRAAGWQTPEEMQGHHPSGFVPSHSLMPFLHAFFFQNEGRASLNVTIWQGQHEQADVRLHLEMNSQHASRVLHQRRRRRMRGMYEPIPPMAAPLGARQIGGGGSGSDEGWLSTATLETDLDLAALAAHYAGQLEKAGWKRAADGQSGPLAWHTWTFVDEDQEPWEGLFSIFAVPGKPRKHTLSLFMEWVNKPEPQESGVFSALHLS